MMATAVCFTGPNTPALVTGIVRYSPERYAVLLIDGPDKGCEGVVPRGWLQERVPAQLAARVMAPRTDGWWLGVACSVSMIEALRLRRAAFELGEHRV